MRHPLCSCKYKPAGKSNSVGHVWGEKDEIVTRNVDSKIISVFNAMCQLVPHNTKIQWINTKWNN